MPENFTGWLMSIDGDRKLARQAKKHERIVMSIVRHNDDEKTYHEVSACPFFLNSWMKKLTGEKKEAATIKTRLCSVKHFLDFAFATENNILGNTNIYKVRVFLWQWRNTLYKEMQEHSCEKKMKTRKFFLKPEEIRDLDMSQVVIMVMRSLENSLTVLGFTAVAIHENMPEPKKHTANLLSYSLGMAEKEYAIFDKAGKGSKK